MGHEGGQIRREDKARRKFACEGEERWGQEEGSREVCLIEEEGTSAGSKAERTDMERGRLRLRRKRAYSWTTVPKEVGGHRV